MNALWLILSVLAYNSWGRLPANHTRNRLGDIVYVAHLVVIAIGIAGFLYEVAT